MIGLSYVFSVCTLTQILEVLGRANKLDEDTITRTKQFIIDNQISDQNGGANGDSSIQIKVSLIYSIAVSV